MPVAEPIRCLVVLGPTATGKTRLAVELARRFRGEIVSADSRQVYRGLDLGTGKDLEDYGTGIDMVPHHLIDVCDPGEPYHLFRYLESARAIIRDIAGRECLPIVAGGTALYVNALLDEYELPGGAPDPVLREELAKLTDEELLDRLRTDAPDLFERTDKTQRKRVVRAIEIAHTRTTAEDTPSLKLDPLLLAPYYPRQEVHKRIEQRLDARLDAGLIEEVTVLHEAGASWQWLDDLGLEYRYVSRYLRGELTREQMREELFTHIRRFCKSQDIWARKMEREGKVIHWLPGGNLEQAIDLVHLFLAGRPLPAPQLRLMETFYGPRNG
jgi:tRNA dimethylallyltransferase